MVRTGRTASLFPLACLVLFACLYLDLGATADSDARVSTPLDEHLSGIDAEVLQATTADDFASLYVKYRALFPKHEDIGVEVTADRLAVFRENVEFIQKENQRQSAYVAGLSQFADLSFAEFSELYLMPTSDRPSDAPPAPSGGSPQPGSPASFDWRSKNAVNEPRMQGKCGSCWAFATIAALESMHFLKTGELLKFSEQQLIDCATGTKYDLHGCSGGLPRKAYPWIQDHRGVASLAAYPYQCALASSEECKASTCHDTDQNFATIGGSSPTRGPEELLNAVLTKGPTTVLVNVRQAFQHYRSGVLEDTECGTRQYNHAVVVTGYGTTDGGLAYWNVKNSWGPTWGVKGYLSMKRGVNQCGIENWGIYPWA